MSQMLFYNRDFYCIQIHDKEVACDGLLFNNIFQMPWVKIYQNELDSWRILFDHIKSELRLNDNSSEEMERIYLKQIIIRATRIWKNQHLKQFREISVYPDYVA